MKAKLQLTTEDGTFTVEVDSEKATSYGEFINSMVRPISHANGWMEGTINTFLGDYQEVNEKETVAMHEALRRIKGRWDDDGGVTSSPEYEESLTDGDVAIAAEEDAYERSFMERFTDRLYKNRTSEDEDVVRRQDAETALRWQRVKGTRWLTDPFLDCEELEQISGSADIAYCGSDCVNKRCLRHGYHAPNKKTNMLSWTDFSKVCGEYENSTVHPISHERHGL